MTQRNPVFWLMWALPGAAVLAGFATLAIAMQNGDRALPDIYHWEGELLDADFERARQAARLGLGADLVIEAGQCTVTLTPAPADTDKLQLRLVNGTDVHLDRAVDLASVGSGEYTGACAPLQRGRWRVSVQDTANTWYLRGQLDDAQTRVSIVARDPEGRGT